MSDHRGWLGSLKSVLKQAETTHQPRPDGADIVEIPQGLERLRKAIVSVQSQLVEAQTERADYDEAWRICRQQVEAAYAANALKQRDLATRLARLQSEWVEVSKALGVKAEVVPVSLGLPDGPVNDQGGEPC